MYPLPTQTIHLALQYISPLTAPLPPHLISTPLRQRHHFLQLLPSSPIEYLCWPSPDNTKVIDLLDCSPLLSDQTNYLTRYTSDPECTFAHVQISSGEEGLRMLFHWDDIHGWKYHDLRLMPFPSSSFSTPEESLAGDSAYGTNPPRLSSPDFVAEADHISNGSDHSYWDAYGEAGQHVLISPSPLSGGSKPGTAVGEDAYWAQYASVQGSADSTLPSPLSISRKLRPVNPHGPTLPSPPQIDPAVDVPVDAIHSRPLASTLGPPSPNMLVRLLNAVSPKKDGYPSDVDDPCPLKTLSAYSIDLSPEQTIADSELVTPPLPSEFLDASVVSFDTVPIDRIPVSQEDKALTDSIKGLYYLWKTGRKESDEKAKSVFLRIVHRAIAYE